MSNTFEKVTRSLVLALGVIIIASPAAFCAPPGLNSNSSSVALTASLAETLTISAPSTAPSITLVSGGTSSSTQVAITTTWVLSGSRANVTLVGWFANSAQALTSGGSVYIPSSEVLGQVTSGAPTTYTAFTQAATGNPSLGVAGASLVLFTAPITSANYAANRTDNLNLEINLATQTQLPAGTYTGTLNLQAQAL